MHPLPLVLINTVLKFKVDFNYRSEAEALAGESLSYADHFQRYFTPQALPRALLGTCGVYFMLQLRGRKHQTRQKYSQCLSGNQKFILFSVYSVHISIESRQSH